MTRVAASGDSAPCVRQIAVGEGNDSTWTKWDKALANPRGRILMKKLPEF
eukprot:CAMPEP_0178825498 /NCGR_PEP_ID=MMETSP0746-20121128/6258_1 /TAXON_ID=913974 /ORGANISM="Nitzschia punctata, Strain CCMP561" /LENGTH=49 /DNA_ID= /DNA_START= /DNA_END= /DNA_ORIENTATION=